MIFYHIYGMEFYDSPSLAGVIRTKIVSISGSWEFITGAIVTTHYTGRFQCSPSTTTTLLLTRGIKILSLFVALNLAIQALGISPQPLEWDPQILATVYSHGAGGYATFEILVGIGYTLIVAPVFLYFHRTGWLIALPLIVGYAVLREAGIKPYANTWTILCGVGGILAGYALKPSVVATAERHQTKVVTILAILAVCLVALVHFDLVGPRLNLTFYILWVTVMLSLFCLIYRYRIVRVLDPVLLTFGRYSLLAYIWQMGIIKLADVLLTRADIELNYLTSVCIVTITLYGSLVGVNYLITKFSWCRLAYRWVFH